MGAKVVMVGLDPDVVDFSDPAYAAFPGLNATVLRDALEKDRQALVSEGFDAVYSFWDTSERAQHKFIEDLENHHPDAVMIGAGVRFNPSLTVLFETLINLVRQHAPQARLCFNSGPYDTAVAVARQTTF
ncbi:hypothetical protein [Methylobacterium sp. D48H]